jgi:hypothetical protein
MSDGRIDSERTISPTDPLTPEEGEFYMEVVAALMSMMGTDEVLIPEMHFMHGPYSVMRRREPDGDAPGIRLRLVRMGSAKPQ